MLLKAYHLDISPSAVALGQPLHETMLSLSQRVL